MAYSTGEAAILTLIQSLAAFDTTNTARVKWRQLETGASDKYVILRPGPWTSEKVAVTAYEDRWTTEIEVWRRYVDNTKPADLEDDVDAIVAQLRKYPTLNGASGVTEATIIGGDDMQEIELNNGSYWARWIISCEWTEESQITYAE